VSGEEITRIARTYHAWRGEKDASEYEDVLGFCKSATTDEIAAHGYVLTPGRYVGAEEVEDDEPFEEKMKRLAARLDEQFKESARLEKAIQENLQGLGYGCSSVYLLKGESDEVCYLQAGRNSARQGHRDPGAGWTDTGGEGGAGARLPKLW